MRVKRLRLAAAPWRLASGGGSYLASWLSGRRRLEESQPAGSLAISASAQQHAFLQPKA